ncbi:hypothetical protein D934_06035 [Xylella fastidiosa subsp. sandyi Ann-1]|uniref:Uncharacterized protein n=2 Tax=Xylella fastidiosa TaxID=2371 RepID=A0A060HCT2_XYLFS|nr:hypothetical protein D934_06035 [Xylella fastidiosa subsp. sandyi Ann-1]
MEERAMKKKFSFKRKIPVIIFFITATISYFMIISNETKVGVDYQADAISKPTLKTLISMSWAKGKDLDFSMKSLSNSLSQHILSNQCTSEKCLERLGFNKCTHSDEKIKCEYKAKILLVNNDYSHSNKKEDEVIINIESNLSENKLTSSIHHYENARPFN